MLIYLVSAIQGFSFGFGLLVAMVPAVWLIKKLPAGPDTKKTLEQNEELLRLREDQNRAIQKIAGLCDIYCSQQ